MANKIFLVPTLVGMMFSCNVLKQTTKETVRNTDTSYVQNVEVKKAENELVYLKSTRDTILTIEARFLWDTLNIESIQPVYDKNGKALPNTRTIQGRGVSVTTTALPSGQFVISAICDSIEKLIPGLTEITISQRTEIDSLHYVIEDLKSSRITIEEAEIKQSSSPWWYWFSVGVLSLLAVWAFSKFIFGFKIF